MPSNHINIKDVDLLWLAGLFEGDGTFSVRSTHLPVASIRMIDKDIIQKVADFFGLNIHNHRGRNNWSDAYSCSIQSTAAEAFFKSLLPYMGKRRSNKINNILFMLYNHIEKEGYLNFSSYLTENGVKYRGYIYRDLYEKRDTILEEHKTKSITYLSKKYGFSHPTISKVINGVPPSTVAPPQETSISVFGASSVEDQNKYYLAGLLEAEGSFMKGPPSAPNQPCISIQMTDEDVMIKACDILRTSHHSWQRAGKCKSGENYKIVYVALLRGSRAVGWMQTLRPLMGSRRQGQIDAALSSYNPNFRQRV